MVLRFALVESSISVMVIFAARLRELQYLMRERGQGRAKGLLVFHLWVYILVHREEALNCKRQLFCSVQQT